MKKYIAVRITERVSGTNFETLLNTKKDILFTNDDLEEVRKKKKDVIKKFYGETIKIFEVKEVK